MPDPTPGAEARCPTCGRRPSERIGVVWVPVENAPRPEMAARMAGDACPDTMHDLADTAPALRTRVRELETFAWRYAAHDFKCDSRRSVSAGAGPLLLLPLDCTCGYATARAGLEKRA